MRKMIAAVSWTLDNMIGLLLMFMTAMVFLNVVLRYGFHSGIGVSEELSRYCCVWLTFLAAITACRDQTYVRVTTFLARMPEPVRKIVIVLGHFLVLCCCCLLLVSSHRHAVINSNNFSPISGISVGWFFIAGCIGAAGMGLSTLVHIFRLLAAKTGKGENAR